MFGGDLLGGEQPDCGAVDLPEADQHNCVCIQRQHSVLQFHQEAPGSSAQ